MSGPAEPKKYKNPVLNWIEFRLPIISYFEREYGDYPMPKNCNYFWSFGALATIILVVMIVSGIFLAMNGYDGFIQTSELSWLKKPPHPSKILQLNEKITVIMNTKTEKDLTQ